MLIVTVTPRVINVACFRLSVRRKLQVTHVSSPQLCTRNAQLRKKETSVLYIILPKFFKKMRVERIQHDFRTDDVRRIELIETIARRTASQT